MRRCASTSTQDEDAVRDLLARMVAALDHRRPWPEPPYRPLSTDEVWADLRDRPPIGRIPMPEHDIEKHLNQPFATTGPTLRRPEHVMAFRLRTGQVVALRAARRRADHVELYAAANPAATRDAFRDLTGLDVQTPTRSADRDSSGAQADPGSAAGPARPERAITGIPSPATQEEREAYFLQIQRDDWREWLRMLNGWLYTLRMNKAHSYMSNEEYLDSIASLRVRFADAGIEFPEDL